MLVIEAIDLGLVAWAQLTITRLLRMPELESEDVYEVNVIFRNIANNDFFTISDADVKALSDFVRKYGDRVKPTVFEGGK